MKDIVEETIKLINKTKLEELARGKDRISMDLEYNSKPTVEHLIRVYLWRDDEYNMNHWITEISTFNYIYKYSLTNKYPTFKQLQKWYLEDELHRVSATLSTLVKRVCAQEKKDVPQYDKSELYNFIQDYLIWLCEQLSETKTGEIADEVIENKIKSMLDK